MTFYALPFALVGGLWGRKAFARRRIARRRIARRRVARPRVALLTH